MNEGNLNVLAAIKFLWFLGKDNPDYTRELQIVHGHLSLALTSTKYPLSRGLQDKVMAAMTELRKMQYG